MKYEALEQVCKDMGYHGICPEALDYLAEDLEFQPIQVRHEYWEFMKNAREMFEPVDDEPYEMSDVEADADTLRNCGWGTDEDYGYADEVL